MERVTTNASYREFGIRPRVVGGESDSLRRDASSHCQSASGGRCTPPRSPSPRRSRSGSLSGSVSPSLRVPVLSRFSGMNRGGSGSNGSHGGSIPAPLSPSYHRRALSPQRKSLRTSQRQHAAELRPLFLQATEALGDRGDRPEEPFRGYGDPKEIIPVFLGQCGQTQPHVTQRHCGQGHHTSSCGSHTVWPIYRLAHTAVRIIAPVRRRGGRDVLLRGD